MLGIAPTEVGDPETDAFGVLTALARGTPQREAWEMTKWFDTNYHYVVPEIAAPVKALRPLPWREPLGDADVTWPILGPYSLVKLSKLADGLDPVEIASSSATHCGTGYVSSPPTSASRSTSRASAWQ